MQVLVMFLILCVCVFVFFFSRAKTHGSTYKVGYKASIPFILLSLFSSLLSFVALTLVLLYITLCDINVAPSCLFILKNPNVTSWRATWCCFLVNYCDDNKITCNDNFTEIYNLCFGSLKVLSCPGHWLGRSVAPYLTLLKKSCFSVWWEPLNSWTSWIVFHFSQYPISLNGLCPQAMFFLDKHYIYLPNHCIARLDLDWIGN